MLNVLSVGEGSHRRPGQAEQVLVEATRACGDLVEGLSFLHPQGSLSGIVPKEAFLARLAVVLLEHLVAILDVHLELSFEVVVVNLLVCAIGHLAVQVVSVTDDMLVAVQVEIELVLLHHGQEVKDDISEVRVPLAPHWMVQDGGLPEKFLVLFPFEHGLVDPIVHIVALGSGHWVITDHVSQLLMLRMQQHVATRVAGIRVVCAEHEARIEHQEAHFFSILAHFDLLRVVKIGHLPLLVLRSLVELEHVVEVAVMVAANGVDLQVFEVFALKQGHHSRKLLIRRIVSVLGVEIVACRNKESSIIDCAWLSLALGLIDGVEDCVRVSHVLYPAKITDNVEIDSTLLRGRRWIFLATSKSNKAHGSHKCVLRDVLHHTNNLLSVRINLYNDQLI